MLLFIFFLIFSLKFFLNYAKLSKSFVIVNVTIIFQVSGFLYKHLKVSQAINVREWMILDKNITCDTPRL